MTRSQWLCCQLGAREHYAVPRALHQAGRLRLMVTDAWVRPGHPLSSIPGDWARRLSERYHPDLESAEVRDHTTSLLKHEVEWRFAGLRGWDLFIPRNEWFQREAAEHVRTLATNASQPTIVFAHSYSALHILRAAKLRGWTTVLGQIDPGEEHFKIVQRLAEARPDYGPPPAPPPAAYLASWREECALADCIVVNSEWSREALSRTGVDASRVRVVPLAHERGGGTVARSYPPRFSTERPLRLLFVGTVSVAKGAAELLEAVAQSAHLPVRLLVAGATGMQIPERFRAASIEFTGTLQRGEMARVYAESDVLVFPSHSDGFGMAQIEAQAAALPIIASQHCGQVVEDGVTGWLLPTVSAEAIASAIERVVAEPALLAACSRHAAAAAVPGLAALGDALVEVVER